MTKRPTNLQLDDQLCFALYAATNTIIRAYRPLLERIGLTYPQYLVMMVLWQDGEHAVNEIAARLALPPHALSPLLDRLESAGLVSRSRLAPDRRVVHVQLTAAGTELEAAAALAQRTVARQTQLDAADLNHLRDDLHHLVNRMDPREGARRQRRCSRPAPSNRRRATTNPRITTQGEIS